VFLLIDIAYELGFQPVFCKVDTSEKSVTFVTFLFNKIKLKRSLIKSMFL